MKFDLSRKKAVITGGSNGIGKAIANTLKNQGAEVFILDLNENQSHKKAGIQTIITDITQWSQINSSLTSIPNTVDILINNAGIGFVGNIEQTEEADFDRNTFRMLSVLNEIRFRNSPKNTHTCHKDVACFVEGNT